MKTKELTDNELLQVNGGVSANSVNWPDFGAAIMTHGGGAIPALAEMVCAIQQRNWSRVANLALQPAIITLPIVINALAAAQRS